MLSRARQMLDDPGDSATGVREPRRPLSPDGAMTVGLEIGPRSAGGGVTN